MEKLGCWTDCLKRVEVCKKWSGLLYFCKCVGSALLLGLKALVLQHGDEMMWASSGFCDGGFSFRHPSPLIPLSAAAPEPFAPKRSQSVEWSRQWKPRPTTSLPDSKPVNVAAAMSAASKVF
ncbi:hypothetical protein AAC387_Pa05g2972 [Persea americana]